MNQSSFTRTTFIIFLAIGLTHLARAMYGWPVTINGWSVPFGFSWVVALIAGYIALQGFQLTKRK